MIGIGIGISKMRSDYQSLQSQYWYFDDGETYMRKGTRFIDPNQKFGVDIRLTDSPGFAGIEDTDFEMIYPIIT
jgi:hypothetical protein